MAATEGSDNAARPPDRLQQAIALHQRGQMGPAARLYEEVLAETPERFDALHFLGILEAQRGNPAAAMQLLARAVAANPGHAAAHSNLGNVLRALGRAADALACYDRALALQPDHPEFLNNRGAVLQALGREADALASYDRALALRSDFAPALVNRGDALAAQRRFEEALASYERALEHAPSLAQAHHGRGSTLLALGRYAEALDSCDAALRLRPDFVGTLYNRANALVGLRRHDEALACYAQVLAREPGHLDALNNRGMTLQDLGRSDEALACFERALSIAPDNPTAHWNLALCRLLVGDYEHGWPEYEWRWVTQRLGKRSRAFAQPLWLGVEDLHGKTILLHAEQGFGDTFQFCRFVAPVAALGARVVLEAPRPLASLLASIDGIERIVVTGESLPAFDVHCPLPSLPLALHTTLATLPGPVPYLRADPRRARHWEARLGARDRLRIGLVWSGGAGRHVRHDRSIPLGAFAKMLPNGVQYVSLQKEVREADRSMLEQRGDIAHFGDELGDFGDTAALAQAMDLVVSVDTAAAHMAGALGRKTWVLLPFAADWRWLERRTDSPWYPTTTLFRQTRMDDWSGVADEVGRALRAFARG